MSNLAAKPASDLSVSELEQVLHDKRLVEAASRLGEMDTISAKLDQLSIDRRVLREQWENLRFKTDDCPNRLIHRLDFPGCRYCGAGS